MTALEISRVSTNGSGVQTEKYCTNSQASLSSNGNLLVFSSNAGNLVSNDQNYHYDVFVKDLSTGTVSLVSASAAGTPNNGSNTTMGSLSSDGRYVAFTSDATNLVTGDTNGKVDLFIKDLVTGGIQRVSVEVSGTQGNNDSFRPGFSPDGKYVLFESYADNLVAGDTNTSCDVFLKNLTTGAVTLVSTDANGVKGNSSSTHAQFSANGNYVVFESTAANLVSGDTNSAYDIFVKNLATGAIQLASSSVAGSQGNSGSQGASISSDGQHVAFLSTSTTLVSENTNHVRSVFVKNLTTGAIQLVSTSADGIQGNNSCSMCMISDDGRYVAFVSDSDNLVAGDTNNKSDVFIKELATGAIQRVSTSAAGVEGNAYTGADTLKFSADGKYLVFSSGSTNLVEGDTNSGYDIFRITNPLWSSTSSNVVGTGNNDTLNGTTANDLIQGLNGNDGLNGLAGNDTLEGGSGNDTLNGGTGQDSMTGGSGNDTYVVDRSGDKVIELASGGNDGVKASISLTLANNVENLILTGTGNINGAGNASANILTGNSAANMLKGLGGNDRLLGNAGNDVLDGGVGNDTLSGGAGADKFDFSTATDGSANVDTILDFNAVDDTIRLDNDIFTAFTTENITISSGNFWASTTATSAHDTDDRIIYNTTSGALYYDADGNGAESAIQFAVLGASSHPTVTYQDFFAMA